jgi:GNAT superfamily N-acetyltransferase
MSSANPIIRAATADDAVAIGELAQQFADYLRGLGDQADFRFNAEAYLRDGFGPHPAFAGLVAEVDGRILGYLLYHPGYDTDRAIRLLHIIDLYVHEDVRRQGIGQALMQAAARICQQSGGHMLFWSVYAPNKLAAEFYEHLGARYTKGLNFMYWSVSPS